MSIPSSALTGPMAELRLGELGLEVEELQECMYIGYTHAAGCTDHDPRSLPGTLAWGKGMGHLRDATKPRGWKTDRTSNFETAVHPTNSHAVAIAAGTSETGRADGTPRTKTPKGPATSRAVKRNAQLQLGQGTGVFAGTGAEEVEDKDRETWILLHHFDPEADEIRLELSSPLGMEGAAITVWRQRIILPPIDFVFDVEIDITPPEDDVSIDIDVPRRRAD